MGEVAGPTREGAQPGKGEEVERAVAGGNVAGSGNDDDIGVERAGPGGRGVVDPGARWDRLDVRCHERAELSGPAVVVPAFLRDVEIAAARRGRDRRGQSGQRQDRG